MSALWNNDWAYDPWYNFNRIASPAWQFWHYNAATDRTSNNGSAEYGRLSNGVFYDSPDFGGLSVHLSGSPEKSSGVGAGTGRGKGVSLNYDQGAVSAMLAGEQNSNGDRVYFLGGKYSFGALAVMGAYDNSKYESATTSTAKVFTLGATYGMGSNTLKVGYGRLDLDGAKTDFYSVGAEHALSKRSNIYVSVGHNRPNLGSSATASGVGISHSF